MQENQEVGAKPAMPIEVTEVHYKRTVVRSATDDLNVGHRRPRESQNRALETVKSYSGRFRRFAHADSITEVNSLQGWVSGGLASTPTKEFGSGRTSFYSWSSGRRERARHAT